MDHHAHAHLFDEGRPENKEQNSGRRPGCDGVFPRTRSISPTSYVMPLAFVRAWQVAGGYGVGSVGTAIPYVHQTADHKEKYIRYSAKLLEQPLLEIYKSR